MKKIISYRQTIIELARIYKIYKVLDLNKKFTTYEIELELLKNNVPIPSRRGYFSHIFINTIRDPSYILWRKNLLEITNRVERLKQITGKYYDFLIEIPIKYYELFIETLFTIINLKKYRKKLKTKPNNFFYLINSNINKFNKFIVKNLIDGLNKIYNLKFDEKIINKFILRGAYGFILAILVSGGIYFKQLVNDVDGLKKTVQLKSEPKKTTQAPADLKENKSKNLIKKKTGPKRPYDPDKDYVLNTQTVLNLFDDLEYNLDHVRKKKVVKPIYFTRLPKDLVATKSVTQKKETFLQILLPLVVAENQRIIKDKKYLLKILKENESPKKTNWINKKYKEYRVSKKNIDELIEKMDIIPTSIALAQAAKESGWGTSRFALEGNAIYGQWTWNGDGIEPLEKTKNQNHKILKFPLLRASVKAYIANLNTHRGYKRFRVKRAELRKKNKKLAGLELIHELDNYAQTGKEYTRILEQIIKQNDLDELETVIIDDFKEKNQLKL